MAPPERKRRGRLIAAGVAIALLLLAGGAAAFVVLNQPKDVSNPNVEFREEAPSATPEEELEPEERPGRTEKGAARRPLHLGALRLHARPAALPAVKEPRDRRSATTGSTRATCCSSSRP